MTEEALFISDSERDATNNFGDVLAIPLQVILIKILILMQLVEKYTFSYSMQLTSHALVYIKVLYVDRNIAKDANTTDLAGTFAVWDPLIYCILGVKSRDEKEKNDWIEAIEFTTKSK